MDLTIIRHGECLAQCDDEARIDPDSALSPLGQQQARLAGQRLAAMKVTHIISSPLLRALETAHIIAEEIAITQIDVWMAVREGYSSTHRGFPRSVLAARFSRAIWPDEITEEGWGHGDDTYQHFFARADETAKRFIAHFGQGDHVVLVTHGGFANYLLHALLHIPLDTPTWFELANGSLTRVRLPPAPGPDEPVWPLYPPARVEIHSINEAAHLQ
jgi:broad specificity phosphatase PhoE